jgi:Conserved hypothetical ATP binding protein
MTQASRDVEPLHGPEKKGTTTVAMDWGRITLASDLVLFLFGTPGQPRFWRLWDDLTSGASAAIVLLDSCGEPLLDRRGDFPGLMYMTPEEREEYDREEARYLERHAQKAQNYTVHTTAEFFAHGLNSRSGR